MMPATSKAMPTLPVALDGLGPKADGWAQRLEDALRQVGDRVVGLHVLNQDGELVTAQPGRCVRRPEAADEVRRHLLQQEIALAVSQAVVDRLEVVQIDEEHGQVRSRPSGAGQRVIEPVLEQGLVGQAGQRVVEGPVGQLVFEALAVGDVPEAQDAADDVVSNPLGSPRPLHHAPVPELQGVETLELRAEREPVPDEPVFGLGQLIEGEAEGFGLSLFGEELLGDVPDLGEAAVESGDLSRRVDHQDAVGRRFEGGGQEREGFAQPLLGGDLGGGVEGRDHVTLDGRIVQQVHDAEFERDGRAAVVAQQLDPGGDGMRRRSPSARHLQGGRQPLPVLSGHDVDERPLLEQLGVVPQEPGDGARHRQEGAAGREQHDDRAGVVHERAEARLVAPTHLVAAALGQVTYGEQDDAVAAPFHRGADDLDQAKPRRGLDPDLNGCPDVAAVDGGQRTQDEFVVVGVHQVEARLADPVVQRALKHALGRTIAPHDVAGRIDHDDGVGQAQEGLNDGGGLVGGVEVRRRARGLGRSMSRSTRAVFPRHAGAVPDEL